MANDLNFKVILDDAEFNEKVEKDVQVAKDLNVSLSSLLEVKAKVGKAKISTDAIKIERFKKATADAAAAQERLNTATINTATAQERQRAATLNTATAQERLTQAQKRTEQIVNRNTAQIERQNRAYKQQSRLLSELKGYALGYLSIHGASQLLSSLVRVTGEFELQKTTLAAMLGDLNSAEQIIAKIQGLAVESPFQFKELTTYAKQLSAFSVPAQELYDTTKMLADISAGLGVGMDRIVLAYGQVRSAAFLRGQEVRQFTEAGIPILDELAKQFTELEGRVVSAGEVFDKISKRLVPFEMVAKVFQDMTSEGGKFYNMQEVQAETLKGKISNLKDAYEMMLNEIGKGQSENLKGAVDWMRKLMTNYEDTGRVLVELVAAYGVYKTALISLTVATNAFELANHKLISSLVNAAKWAASNPYVVLAAGITAVGYGMYKAITHLEAYERVQRAVIEAQDGYASAIHKEGAELDALYAKLRVAKEGTEEYDSAKRKIYSQYASYISELKEEGKNVENLASLYGNLKSKIEDAAKSRFRMTALRDVEDEYATGMDKFYKRFELLAKNMGNAIDRELMAVEKEALWQYLLGDEDALKIPEAEGIRPIATDMGSGGYGYLVERAKKEAKTLIDTYEDAKEKIDALFGKEKEVDSTPPSFVYNVNDVERGKSDAQKAIEEQIKSIQKLQDAYEKLLPFLDDIQMKSTLKNLFPKISEGVIDSLDFTSELHRLADQLEEFDEDAAQRLRDTISKDVAGAMAESFNAIEQYKRMLDSWLGEDFDVFGEGTAFDISKILQNLNNEYARIDQKRQKALDLLNKAQLGDEIALAKVREIYGEEVWQKYLENGTAVINELANKEAAAARKTANEKIRDLSSKDLKERMEKANINLTDFDEKTIKQVEDLYNRLYEIYDGIQSEIEGIIGDGVTEDETANLQRLEDELKQLGIIINDTGEELKKKVFENVREGMSSVAEFGTSIENLGKSMRNSAIEKFGKNLNQMASQASDLAERLADDLQAKDTIALITNLATTVISEITSIFSAAYEKQVMLNEAAREYAELLLEIRRESYSGVFGTDEMALAAENQQILADAQEDYDKAISRFQNERADLYNKRNYSVQWDKTVESLLSDFASADGWDLYRENGELNLDAMKAYYESYAGDLTSYQKEMVDALIASYDALNDASAQSAEYMTSLFSSAADAIAEKMVGAFIESGDAATDLRGVVSDVASQMATDLIKTLYIMPILNQYAEDLKAIAANDTLTADEKTAAALGVLQTGVEQIKDNEDAINETLAQLDEYFVRDGEGTKDLGEGIKGITEDQANLLASYLNAIRADVSYSKALWVKMDSNLQRIADMLTSSPSLMEYQAQIAANTYNTAVATQEILSELRGVISFDTGDAAIRVNS